MNVKLYIVIVVWLRSWWRHPLLTGQFSLTIAVGMGAASALTSLTLALGYQRLPFRDAGQLVAVWERSESGSSVMAISGPEVTDFANSTHGVFSALGAFAVPRVWLFDAKGASEVSACYVQANIYRDLGIHPILGRGVLPDDKTMGTGATIPAWISYRFWRARYNGNRSVIGMKIGITTDAAGLDQQPGQIVGILPPHVSIPLPLMQNETDVWYLLSSDVMARLRQAHLFFGLGRLRPGVTVEQAQAALAVVGQNLGRQYSVDRGRLPVVESLEEIAQGPGAQDNGPADTGRGPRLSGLRESRHPDGGPRTSGALERDSRTAPCGYRRVSADKIAHDWWVHVAFLMNAACARV